MSSLFLNGGYSSSRPWRFGAGAGAALLISFAFLDAQEADPTLDALLAELAAEEASTAPSSIVLPDEERPDAARQFIIDLRQELRFSDNPDLDANSDAASAATARSSADLSYLRRSGVDRLELGFGADLDLRSDAESGIESARVNAEWVRDVRRANIGLSFNHAQVNLGSDTTAFLDTTTGTVDVDIIDRGTREATDLALTGGFGIDAPFGGTYQLSQSYIRYSDTEDPDLLDADRFAAEGTLSFGITPRITLGLEGEYSTFDEDGTGAIDTNTRAYGVFADTQVTSRLQSTIRLGWREVEDIDATTTSVEDGTTFGADFTQDRPRGSNFLSLTSTISSAGRESELRLGQSFTRPTRELSYYIGVVDFEDAEDLGTVIGLTWTEELPRGAISLVLEQSPFSDADGSQINTRLTLGYDQALTEDSSFSVDVSYLNVEENRALEPDAQRLDLGVTYRRTLTEDWDLETGISVIRAQEDGTEDRDANTFFVGVARSFVWN